MSFAGNSSGISFAGLSSGIDTESIITRLLQLEALPAQRLQTQQQQIQQKKELYSSLKQRIQAFQSASTALNSATAFNPIKASSSKTEVATVTADSGSIAGTYSLSVTRLAQSHKISSAAQTSATDPLALSGNMVVNGKGVVVDASDTLKSIAQKINAAGAGVTASIIDGGSGSAYLTLNSGTSGAAGQVQIGDLDGTVAQSLGLAAGALAPRETITGGFTSTGFSSSSTPLAQMLGFSGLGTQSFSLNGTAINVDLSTATLQDVANAINTSGSGANATVRSVTVNGSTVQKLDITGATTQDDSNGVLQGLGLLQKGYSHQLLAAQDAAYTLDNVSLTSATNVITGVIPGATLTLIKGNETTPETSTITLARDDDGVKAKIKDFGNAFNGVVDFVKQASAFDKETFQSGGLFGDAVSQSIESQLANNLFNSVGGLSVYSNLTQLGFSFDENGKVTMDDAKIDAAIKANPDAVGRLFRNSGSSTNSQISFVSASNKAVALDGGFSIVINQAATQHRMQAEVAQAGPLATAETMSFTGALFGTTPYTLNLDAGMTQEQIAAKINGDARLKDLVSATIDGGKLTLNSKRYGTNGIFTVGSSQGTAGSGWGTAATLVAGLDVAGTINGETATGSGQLLTGATGNANSDGLQLMYTGTATGAVGNLVYTKGVASRTADMISTFTDAANGLLAASENSLQAQLDTIEDSLEQIDERITRKREQLTIRFARMEEAIASLQSQQAQMSKTLNG